MDDHDIKIHPPHYIVKVTVSTDPPHGSTFRLFRGEAEIEVQVPPDAQIRGPDPDGRHAIKRAEEITLNDMRSRRETPAVLSSRFHAYVNGKLIGAK